MADTTPPRSEVLLYQTEDGRTRIECRFDQGTIWLTQALIAELFQVTPQNVTLHLKAIYGEGELDAGATCKDYLQVRTEGDRGVSRQLRHYNLAAILALAADYQPTEPDTQQFFKTIQNKLHYAATGRTAPELIAERADAAKPNMGLTAWKGQIVHKGDVTIAKNYLHEGEITELNRIVVMFLDYAEDQARRRKQVFLEDWQVKLDDFLRFNERRVLPGAGRTSREAADKKAELEYDRFSERRRAEVESQAELDAMRELDAVITKRSKKTTQGKKTDNGGGS